MAEPGQAAESGDWLRLVPAGAGTDLPTARGWPTTEAVTALRRDGGRVWFVVADGLVVGHVGAVPRGGEVEVDVSVVPGWRRRGIGTGALGALVRRLIADPAVESVVAVADRGNEPSIALLRRVGFREVERRGTGAYFVVPPG